MFLTVALISGLLCWPPAESFAASPAGGAVSVLGWSLEGPAAMVVAGPDLFVADFNDSAVLELDVATGAFVRQLFGPQYGFNGPSSMVVAGPDLFVANSGAPTIVEVAVATGSLVRVISGAEYELNPPGPMALAGPDLFVVNDGGNSVTELSVATGALVRVISSAHDGFNKPGALAADGQDLFVANEGVPLSPPDSATHLGSVTELDTATGALVRVIPASLTGIDQPDAVYAAGPDVFVANYGGSGGLGSVTQLEASSGIVLSQLSEPVSTIIRPDAMTVDGGNLFVANKTDRSVSELDARSATMRTVFSSPPVAAAGPLLRSTSQRAIS
jgi:hypothetical protein